MKSLTSTWNPRIKAFTKSAAFVRAVTSLVSLQVCFKKGTNYRWGWKRQYANRILEMTYLTIIPTLPSFPSIFSITQFLVRQVLCLICKTELSSFKAGEFHPKTVKWLHATTDYTPWLNWLWGLTERFLWHSTITLTLWRTSILRPSTPVLTTKNALGWDPVLKEFIQ